MLTRRMFIAGAAAVTAGPPALAQVVATLGEGPETLTVLSDGGFEMPLSMLARDLDTEVVAAQVKQSPPYRTVLNVTCLRRGKDTILFDCGAGANFLAGSGKLADSLSAAGITPDSVTHVVFTHLHPDHFGRFRRLRQPAVPKCALARRGTRDRFLDRSEGL